MTSERKHYVNLARTCKNKSYENKIKFNWLKPLKKSIMT